MRREKQPLEPLYPQLKARRNASAGAVAAHQRTRLHAAMIEACASNGYTASTAEDVVRLAGVSKKTLFKHFGSKEECFLATYDLVVRDAVGRIMAAYRAGPEQERDWAAGLWRAFDAFATELVERPGPSRLALVEVLAAGPAALDRIARAEAIFTWMLARSFEQADDDVTLPPALLRGLVGGVWLVSRSRLLEGRAETIAACGRELFEWIRGYRSPGLALLSAATFTPPRGARSDGPVAGPAEARTRMLRAAAAIVASGGYASLSGGQIAEEADVAPENFAAEFASPRECFLESLELIAGEALSRALRESREAPSWAAAICQAIHSLFCQVAADQVFARAAFVEAFATGSEGAERRAELMRGFAAALIRRAPPERRPTPLVAEAVTGAVWSLAHRHVVRGRARQLPALSPQAAYLALAPILGAEQALGVIGASASVALAA